MKKARFKTEMKEQKSERLKDHPCTPCFVSQSYTARSL